MNAYFRQIMKSPQGREELRKIIDSGEKDKKISVDGKKYIVKIIGRNELSD
jgi:hypothetical protein